MRGQVSPMTEALEGLEKVQKFAAEARARLDRWLLIDIPFDSSLEGVRRMIRLRRRRERLFAEAGIGGDLFGEPAWDILLEAYLARKQKQETSVTSLCHAAAAPQSTALRHIKLMVDKGLLVRRDDPRDQRRVFIAISDFAADLMEQLLSP